MYRQRRVAIVLLARMGSSRLPGKVLLPFGRGSVLSTMAERLRACRFADELVLATSSEASDDPVAEAGSAAGLAVVRGSQEDVVARMLQAVEGLAQAPDVVVRACADNPLVMPGVVDDAIMELVDTEVDLITPFEHPSYPFGFSLVAMTREALERIDREAREPAYREHVENYCFEAPQPFRLRYHVAPLDLDYPELCATLDQPVDLQRLRTWESWLRDVPLEGQAGELVRRVREARVWYEGFSQSGGMEWDLIVTSDPEPLRSLAPSVPLGIVTVDRFRTGSGERWGLRYLDDCDPLFPRGPLLIDWRRDADQESARSFLARVAPFARRLLAAGPVRELRAQETGAAPAKAPHAERRVGFRAPQDALFPPRIALDLRHEREPLELVRHLALALEREPFLRLQVRLGQRGAALDRRSRGAGAALEHLHSVLGHTRVVRDESAPLPDPFGTLRVEGSGRVWIVERGPSMALGQTSLAAFWRSPAVRRARTHVCNADQILSGEPR